MIYAYKEVEIDLSKVTRLYPAALISAGGESASVSLEWADLKKELITLEAYVLICDFDAVGEVPLNRIELRFETKEELFKSMNEISNLLKS
ncbi:MAG: hypothetical protein ACXWB0_07460 [Sulfuricurvum sp.]